MELGEFTVDEIVTLLSALDVWEKEATGSALISSMFGMMLSKDKEEGQAFMENEFGDADRQMSARKEDAAIIRAKLVLMKREMVANQLFSR